MKKSTAKIIDLNEIKVRPITSPQDIDDAVTILSSHHPLGCRKAQGRRMYYVATCKRDWVAVLLFDSAVERNHMRESTIGWSREQCKERRQHVANNSRFLVGEQYRSTPNLASKILSLVAERISADWIRRYGIPLLALETYVDPSHNQNEGTCYSAAGWERLGLSTGYTAFGAERTHGKWYFLKALHERSYEALRSDIPHALMTGVKEVSGESNSNFVFDAAKFDIKDLQKALSAIDDPRTAHGLRYRFAPLLSLCIAAAMSGHTQYRQIADWIRAIPVADRNRFGLRGARTPAENTIGKFLKSIDPTQLSATLTEWLQKTYPRRDGYKFLILDGKALRGTHAEAASQAGFLNVFAAELGVVIEQVPCQKGGGEKVAARNFVDGAKDLEGKVFLADAIHADRKFVTAVSKKKLSTRSLSKIIIQS
jgi:hypothetical protein